MIRKFKRRKWRNEAKEMEEEVCVWCLKFLDLQKLSTGEDAALR